ncbi:hypothetical protein GE09DRAFT_1109617 [Coniochaeta sp. 2T2.1]|nr:hypothetical protein GE09DRAFT_1109617 [Coniochaeta sp. 2T2.1]
MTKMAPTSFEFVVQQGDKAFSKVTQTKIRRQAMKAVAAARRQTGQYGKHNLRQHEISYTSTESSSDSSLSPTAVPVGGDAECDSRAVVHKKRSNTGGRGGEHYPKGETEPLDPDQAVLAALHKLSSTMFHSELELFMMDYSIQPADLSALTTIHIAPVASAIFTAEPSKLRDLLACRQWSYFEHLYSRYGQSPCLDDAIRCLIIVCQGILAPSPKTSSGMILAQYGKALKSLQEAINEPTGWANVDTLCATNILQLFSAVYPQAGSPQTWSQHLAGCMRMIQLRGPHEWKTDYEKALLITLTATMVTESFLQNIPCFLEEPDWLKAVAACKAESDLFSDRSPLAVDMGMLIIPLPGACKRVGDVVCSENPSPEAIEAVRREVRDLRKGIRLWRNRFDTEVLLNLPSARVSAGEKYKRLDALANALIFEIILARLMGSVVPSDRFVMEDEIQQHGAYIARIEQECMKEDYRTAFYMNQKRMIAMSLIESSPLWRLPVSRPEGLIEAWKFRQWCDSVPRRSP